MHDPLQCRQQLNDLLHAEYDCAGQLQSVLTAEASALVDRDINALEALVREKNTLLQTLETLELRKKQVLEQAGLSSAPNQIEASIDDCDERGQLKRGWHLLLQRLARCQQQNRANGATLDSSRRYTQQALSILRGQTVPVALYDPRGSNTSSHDSGRPLAKA